MLRRSLFMPLILGLIGISMFGIVGCYGPSPGLDPKLNIQLGEELPSGQIPAGSSVLVSSDPTVKDADTNPIVFAKWTQLEEIAGSRFLLNTNNAATNVWLAPKVVTTPTPVTLTLTAKTLLGGESAASLYLVVTPAGGEPRYQFNYLQMIADTPDYPSIPGMKRIKIYGAVLDGDGNERTDIVSYSWRQIPNDGTQGFFDDATVKNPEWTAPPTIVDKDGFITIQPYKLQVQTVDREHRTNINTLVVFVM